ncbi:hypothetical protein SAMN04490243_2374 [Robiginitalea myxolifaciens]|uniref:Uncharacterized protein n=1 Tax=Robiginitalea myxolifaciens TaxID=400055 RepID=A0A1I6H7F4_9FLAO|nr:hypothetical protein [Robiginitalea myxolifaciens]SFR50409.1 hypothetical protein SAMN04490243_2374 [Robiginitalea myxolifaciens]
MSQDLRDLFNDERKRSFEMPEGHESRFENRLEKAFSQAGEDRVESAEVPVREIGSRRTSPLLWLGIAASCIGLLGFGIWMLRQPASTLSDPPSQQVVSTDTLEVVPGVSLGDLSPDLKKVETYYTASINLELANLEISDDNKKVVDDFMARLKELDEAYSELSRELNEIGPNEETINAMIRNLQLRLNLLQQLNEKLEEIKQSKNETVTNLSA